MNEGPGSASDDSATKTWGLIDFLNLLSQLSSGNREGTFSHLGKGATALSEPAITYTHLSYPRL